MTDLQRAFHTAKPKCYPSRQRFFLPVKAGEKKATALAPGKKLSDYGLTDGSVLVFKDLGPQVLIQSLIRVFPTGLLNPTACSHSFPATVQIGYTTVFFWEYFGPLVVYALFYFFPGVCYPTYKCVRDRSGMSACLIACLLVFGYCTATSLVPIISDQGGKGLIKASQAEQECPGEAPCADHGCGLLDLPLCQAHL